jgi:very-short-patch-repair endonuclease
MHALAPQLVAQDSTMNSLTSRARSLRKNSTETERRLWYAIRNRRLGGFKFRRQVWLGEYIADFVCVERKLIVELDGGQHAQSREYDERRTAALQARGFRVVRYWNSEVLMNLDGVLDDLLKHLER